MMSYCYESNAYRLWKPDTKTTIKSRYVKFWNGSYYNFDKKEDNFYEFLKEPNIYHLNKLLTPSPSGEHQEQIYHFGGNRSQERYVNDLSQETQGRINNQSDIDGPSSTIESICQRLRSWKNRNVESMKM